MTESVHVRTVRLTNGSKKSKRKKGIDPLKNINPRKFRDRGKEILDAMAPEERARVAELRHWMEEDERKYLENIPAIRKAAELTQSEVAKKLGMAQAGVSRLENQGDMLLSTLGKYLEAVGEHPRLVVKINGEDYELDLGALAENLH